MTKLLLKISAALLGFSLGIISSVGMNLLLPTIPQIEIPYQYESNLVAPTNITVCQLDDFPDKYDGQLIETTATIYGIDDEIILYPLQCFCERDEIHFSFLNLEENNQINHNLLRLLRDPKPYKKEIDIKVIGRVKKFNHKELGKSYLLIPEKIEIISPFRRFTPKARV